MAMRTYHRVGFTAAQSAELWERWKKGEGLKSIGRAFGKPSSCIFAHLRPSGNPQRTIMAALEQSPSQPAPPGGQIKVDMSLITCKQYLSSDAQRRQMIAYW